MIAIDESTHILGEPLCQSCLRSRQHFLALGQVIAFSDLRIRPDRSVVTTVITLCESCLRDLRGHIVRELTRIRGRAK